MSRHQKHHSPQESSQPAGHAPAQDPVGPRHGFPSEHRKGLLPEKYFRWRGGEITRMEAFCDVVFGFAITLLVVSLEVPHTYAELMDDMRGFFTFAICFAQLIMIWRSHYKFSRRYGLEDPYTVFLNVVLLFLVLFYVYPLKFLFTMLVGQFMGVPFAGHMGFHEASVLMRIYAIGFAGVFLLMFLLYAHAYNLRRELELNAVETYETRVTMQESAILVLVGLGSFAIAFRSPDWSGWFYMLLGPSLAIHGTLFGKRTRLLAESQLVS